jgi:hypothetical protein
MDITMVNLTFQISIRDMSVIRSELKPGIPIVTGIMDAEG